MFDDYQWFKKKYIYLLFKQLDGYKKQLKYLKIQSCIMHVYLCIRTLYIYIIYVFVKFFLKMETIALYFVYIYIYIFSPLHLYTFGDFLRTKSAQTTRKLELFYWMIEMIKGVLNFNTNFAVI